jgi:glycosyltransferase involved in cell wall biosynthesis
VTPVKVAHITTIAAGLRYLLFNQLCSLQEAGYEVVGISSPGEDVAALEAAGVRHIAVPMSRNLSPAADLVSLWRLVRVLRRERFVIAHTHNPKPGLLGQLAARLAGVPVVVNTLHGYYFHEHTPWLRRQLWVGLEKIAACCSDVILSQSKEDVGTAVRERICPASAIKYLGNGVDLRRFRPSGPEAAAAKRRALGLPVAAPVVGFVGRLVAEKGLPELLQAARLILRRLPEARFLIVGPTDHCKRDAVTPALADAHGVADACYFTGLREDLPELYALMDVFVLPSHREGFPRVLLEAAAMGVPAVVTDVRGCREAVEHGRNGLHVPLRDVSALADAILRLLLDRGLAGRLGEQAREIAAERFDERRVFATVRAEYERLLAEKGLGTARGALYSPAAG